MSAKSFSEWLAEDHRLAILHALAKCEGDSNESFITTALHGFGHNVSRDQVRTLFTWLKENGLISLEEIADVMIARLTERGFEVEQGIITTPGVKRPSRH